MTQGASIQIKHLHEARTARGGVDPRASDGPEERRQRRRSGDREGERERNTACSLRKTGTVDRGVREMQCIRCLVRVFTV